MRKSLCSKELYKAYLICSSIRYSGVALSEVSPINLSHDSVSRWLSSKNFSPAEIWKEVSGLINKEERSVLIVDDTVLDKSRSQKIDLVNWQYSSNAHDVIAGIGMVNMLWHGIESNHSIPVDFSSIDLGL